MIEDSGWWSFGLVVFLTVVTFYTRWVLSHIRSIDEAQKQHEERCEEDKRIRRAESREDFGEVHKKIDRIIDKLLSKLDELK